MLVGFEKWWTEEGRSLDRETFTLAQLAFAAGIKCGNARSRSYTADDEVMPESVTFANGRTVRIVANKAPGVQNGVFLEVE
jgi:hypothetical protein